MLLAATALLASSGRADAQVVPMPVVPDPPSVTAVAKITPAQDMSAAIGQPIVGADAVLDANRWNDAPPAVPFKANERFSTSRARQILAELLASGNYATGSIDAVTIGPGVRLAVHLTPRKIASNVRLLLHGAQLDDGELLRAGNLAQGAEVSGVSLEQSGKAIQMYAARHGYPDAEVTVVTTLADAAPGQAAPSPTPAAQGDSQQARTLAQVTVDVVPGAARTLERRIFYVTGEGHQAPISAAEPGDRASAALFKNVQTYTVKAKDRDDETTLVAADRALERVLRAAGYDQATVAHDVVRAAGVVTLRVRVDAGPRVDVRFEGNDSYDKDALESALSLSDEDDRSAAHLAQKLRDFYGARGFLDVEVSTTTRTTKDGRLQYLVFHVIEHARVSVRSREYPCLAGRAGQSLAAQHGSPPEIAHLSNAPTNVRGIGGEIDSVLESELPGEDILTPPDPATLDATIGGPGQGSGSGSSPPAPIDLDPDSTYFPDSYDRAALHVQELYRQEGFLSAQVGPVQVIRRACSPHSPPDRCIPIVPKVNLPDTCTYDSSNLPLPVAPLDPQLRCVPDPAHGLECEKTVSLRIPIKLGPRTELYDLAFTGVLSIPETTLAKAANVTLGGPVSLVALDDARRRILDAYKEEGFVYADASYVLESSADHTRARVRFEVREGDQVRVRGFEIHGAFETKESTVLRRITLEKGGIYRASLIRSTQQNLATLGVFSSIQVNLADPYIPQKYKTVVIDLIERPRQYVEVRPGFSTGEGFRVAFEYSHRNLLGDAIGLTFRAQVSYLPTPLILDPTVRANWTSLGEPGFDKRIASRITLGIVFPEIGLGPKWRAGIDGVFIHDLQRDFFITKFAAVPNITYRPVRELQFLFSQSAEDNDVHVFNGSATDYLRENAGNVDLLKLLLFPDYPSAAFAQRLVATWDRRDNAFNARTGTYLVSGIEHVDDVPINREVNTDAGVFEGHFLRLTETFAGYIPLPKGMRIAAEFRFGTNIQLTPTSQTYPDRLFFMGGPDSMRGWLPSTFIPQDDIDRIRKTAQLADQVPCGLNAVPCAGAPAGSLVANPNKFTSATEPIRGGNLMVNPRLELRVPIKEPLETVLFFDTGNLWRRATYPFDTGHFPLRASIGTGIRVQTPVGPLALDYGINLTRHADYEDFGDVHFAIGLY